MERSFIEKSLKRFLKNKISFSTAMLVGFMISGQIVQAEDLSLIQLKNSRNAILRKIRAEKIKIKRKMAVNEKKIKEYNKELYDLVNKGDFYAKPVMPSTQIFFSFNVDESGKGKDNTSDEFSETIQAVRDYYGDESKVKLPDGTTVTVSAEDRVRMGNGVVVDDKKFQESVDLGVNIKLLNPSIPTVSPSVTASVSAPSVTLGALPSTITPSVQPLTIPTVSAPGAITVPTAPTIAVTTPSSIGAITVPTISLTPPSAPGTISSAPITAMTPPVFEPATLAVPGAPATPTTPTISVFTPPNITYSATGFGQPQGERMTVGSFITSTKTGLIIAQNYGNYNGSLDVTAGPNQTSWNGSLTGTGITSSTLTSPNSANNDLTAVISHVDDVDSIVNGTYHLVGQPGGDTGTIIFASINPYMTGKNSASDKTFDFHGDLYLDGIALANSNNVLVGMEHQLLGNGPSGKGEEISLGGGYVTYSPITNAINGNTTSIMKNTGNINLEKGSNMVGIMIDTEYISGNMFGNKGAAFKKLPKTINDGVINIGDSAGTNTVTNSIGIDYGYYVPTTSGEGPNSTVSIGTINVYGNNNYGIRLKDYSANAGKYYDFNRLEGTSGKYITVEGNHNVGISIAQGRSSGDPTGGAGHLGDNGSPDNADLIAGLNVKVGGSENIGFYRNPDYTGSNHDSMVLTASKIGDFGFTTNATKSTLFRTDKDEIELQKGLTLNTGGVKNSLMQAGGTGIVTNNASQTITMNEFYGLTAGDFTSSTGAKAVNKGSLTINGNNSIGMAIASGNTGENSGSITVTGTSGSGIYNKGTFNLTAGNIIADGAQGAGVYNTGTMNISGTTTVEGKNGSSGIFSDGGSVTSTSGNTLTVKASGDGSSAVYGKGATIDVHDANITSSGNPTDKIAGVYADGGSIDIHGSNLDINGTGYAIYTKNNGTVNAKGTQINLSGKSTAFTYDFNPPSSSPSSPPPSVTLDSTTHIQVKSNDVTVFELRNLNSPLSTTNLESGISGLLTGATGGTNIVGHDTGIDNYKIAYVDGGTLNVGDLDKSGTASDSVGTAKGDGFVYYNRFRSQRMNLKLNGSTVKAELSSTQATPFNNQVVGLEQSSSKNATANTDTSIDLSNNSTIIADRTDSGAGAIGTFVNYGLVKIDGGSSINVEKGSNTVNDGGIGVYAVNGSEVTNDGTIDVGGNQAVGIYSTAYREIAGGGNAGAEFGKTGEGTIKVTNTKDIKVEGQGGIGIYGKNNASTNIGDVDITNTGTITVGDAGSTSSSIGILGETATISNTGTIKAGQNGAGIVAKGNSTITDLGIIELKNGGQGVIVENGSNITATSLTLNSLASGSKTGIIYESTSPVTSSIAIDATSFDDGVVLYGKNSDVTNSGSIKVGTNGSGLYSDNASKKVYNTGTIELVQSGATGMVAKNGGIAENSSSGTIDVQQSRQAGMYADGAGSTIKNDGTIKLSSGSTGLYVENGATASLSNISGLDYNSHNANTAIGGYAKNGIIDLGTGTFQQSNVNNNILAFGESGSTINLSNGPLAIDGTGTTPGKTIGVYLDGTTTSNTYNGNSGSLLDVKGKAIGIYSKNNNTLNNLNVSATDSDTAGVYSENGITLTGTADVKANTGGIGIYGNNGAINISSLNIDTNNGTGIYLTNGAYANGGTINITNSGTTRDIGVYYTGTTTPLTHSSDINLNGKTNIGIYADSGVNLTNNNTIISGGNGDNIGVYIKNATYNSTGAITLGGQKDIGILVEEGSATSSGTITLNASSDAIGLGVKTTSGTGTVENTGTINANGNVGMYVGGTGTNVAKNSGTITTSTNGTGLFIEGNQTFNGTSGTIDTTSGGTAVFLKDVTSTAGNNYGTVKLGNNSVAFYGQNSLIDFNINTSSSQEGIALIAKGDTGTTTITGNTISAGDGAIGVYVQDNSVVFNNVTVTTGVNSASKTSTGIYIDKSVTGTGGTPYQLSSVDVNAQNGVGVYLGNDATGPTGATTGANITFDGTVSTKDGIGIYVSDKSTLTTGSVGTQLNIDGGTGIYIDRGTATIGNTGNVLFNFLAGGGTGIFLDNGSLNLGANVTVNGKGSLAATKNGDLSNNGTIKIGDGAVGLYGEYDSSATGTMKTLNNTGTIIAENGGIGMAGVKGSSFPSIPIKIENTGTIIADNVSSTNVPSIGIYTNVADVENTGSITVKDKAMGIYSEVLSGAPNTTTVKNDNMQITGDDAVGVYLKGNTGGLLSNNITSSNSRNTGLVLDNVTSTSPINGGTISLGDESVGILATDGTNITLDGNVSVKNSSPTKSAVGVAVTGGSSVTTSGTMNISAGDKGIGVYVEGTSTLPSNATIGNVGNITVGDEGIYLYSKDSNLAFSGNIVANNQIGVVAEGGNLSAGAGTSITAQNGGIGAYIKGANPSGLNNISFTVNSGTSAKHSVGIYYDNVTAPVIIPTILQNGSYTMGAVLDNSTGTMGNITLNNSGTDQVGVLAKNGSNITTGTLNISGDRNIGVYGENSSVTTADITVGNSTVSPNKQDSSIGVYLNGGNYTGNGNLSVGDNSLGIFGENLTAGNGITFTGNNVTVGNSAVGIYGSGNGGTVSVSATNGITVGDNSSIGISATNMNANVTGDITIGTDTSVGIAQSGDGDINYTGAINIANKVNSGSIGIYKIDGSGTVTTSGNWNIGNSGYGIYVKQTTGKTATVINNADMNLGMSGIGIYSSGNNNVTNNATITVGDTDLGPTGSHTNPANQLNSVAMYLENGSIATNNGTLNVTKEHSVGVFGAGAGTQFTNNGTINVDNAGTGILVRDNAVAINETGANINLGSTVAPCGVDSIGMAAYNNGKIINKGTITVNEGVGMLVNTGATLDNNGVINVANGVGIKGAGTILNRGTVNVSGSGRDFELGVTMADVGAVQIDSAGNIKINGSYVSVGGTLVTQSHLFVNGAYVDVTTDVPVFNAPTISGDVNILPNFATTGNGLTWEVKNFISTASSTVSSGTLTPHISPLFVSKITNNGSLMIAKRPYADITLGSQFDELHNGLDKLLEKSGGKGTDAEMLMGMNEYLASIKDEQQFRNEAGKMLGETRGDIYSTIQKRMQDVNKAFDTAFNELESSYNFTRDTDKYSIIYTKGDFKDSTMGIDDYDYDTIGLLYMKEKEGNKLHTKHGYTLGFAGSKFKFDDGGSKEEVYSLRAGAHNVANLSPKHKISLLTRGELEYNRHQAKRKINLDETYTNKASYNTYGVSFDNKLTKNIYQDFENKLDIYADMNLEYGKVDGFSEKSGGLKLKVKDNDYFSAQAGVGIQGSRRVYLGKLWSAKLTGDVKYAYELGENYDGNKAKLKDGDQGYYKLITPEKEKGKVIGKAGITFEKANNMGVTFDVEASDSDSKDKPSVKYGVRFNYKFFND